LEGDIRMAQQYAGLERQGLDLQKRQLDINQDMINFNKNMLTANTFISATQAAVSLTNAAVGLGKAITELHDQKSDLHIKQESKIYDAGMTQAVNDGYLPYKTYIDEGGNERIELDKNGNPITIGFDDYEYTYTQDNGKEVTRRLGDIKQDAINAVGNNYWTERGSERGMQIAKNAFEEIELRGQKLMAGEVSSQQESVLNQKLDIAYAAREMEEAIKAINEAPHLSALQKEAKTIEILPKFIKGFVHDEAANLLREKGFAAAKEYVDSMKGMIFDRDRAEILSAMSQENRDIQQATSDEIQKRVAQNKESGMSIQGSFNSLMQWASEQGNLQVRSAIEQAAKDEQRGALINLYSPEIAGLNSQSLEQVEEYYRSFPNNQHGDFEGQGGLYAQYYDQAYEILKEKRQQKIADERAADAERHDFLAGRFGVELDGIPAMSLEELKYWDKVYEGREGEYGIGHGTLYKQHRDEIKREIERREQREQSSGSTGSGISDSEVFSNFVHKSFDDWAAGKIDRTKAIDEMFGIYAPSESANKVRDDLFVKMLDADDGSHLTSAQFERLTTTLTGWKIDQSVIDGYRRNFMSMRGDKFTPETARLFVDGVLDQTIATRLSELYKNPNIGWSIERENEILTASNTGRLDVVHYPELGRYSRKEEGAYIPGGETLQARATGIARGEIESQITATVWEIAGEGVELRGGNRNDNTGQVYHTLRNAATGETATVRVKVEGTGSNARRVLEKKEGNEWISFDSSLAAGRAETFRQFERRYSHSTIDGVDVLVENAVTAMQANQNNTAAANLRRQLEDLFGNAARTNEGRAYIESRVDEAINKVDWR